MAATLAEIRVAIKTTLEAAIPGYTVYPTVETVQVMPAGVVIPDDIDYLITFQQGVFTGFLDLYVLCEDPTDGLGQDELDGLIDPFGEHSIPRVLLDANGYIGLPGVQCVPMRMSRYGGSFDSTDLTHVGAVIQLQIVANRGT